MNTRNADDRYLSVVVPVFNEEDALAEMAEKLAPALDAIAGPQHWQFVLVDNGSTDNSTAECNAIAARWPGSLVIRVPRPDYGDALYRGLMGATGPWAFIINVDFWDVAFMRWCFRTRGSYDIVMGSKRADAALNTQNNYRRLLSWGLNVILQTVFGFVGSDTHGLKFLYLPTLRPIFQECVMRRGQFDTEFTLRASRSRLWLAEVPVPISETRPPRNLMLTKIVRNFVDIVRLYRVMKAMPVTAATRYHRWSREDVENENGWETSLLTEMAARHRSGKGRVAVVTQSHTEEPAAQVSR
jgi:glycosyltransferase involved in cell wall biosynthesis